MLSHDGVVARYILAVCFFFASGSGLVTGWVATLCGVLGTIQLANALLGYSPVMELINWWHTHKKTL